MLDFLSGWKAIASFAGLVVVAGLVTYGLITVEQHGEAAGRAELQPKLDAANAALGSLSAANAAQAKTIADLRANDALNGALIDDLNAKIAASAQQAADLASTIRKLQSDDATVDAYLRAPIPDALRSVLNNGGAVAGAGRPN